MTRDVGPRWHTIDAAVEFAVADALLVAGATSVRWYVWAIAIREAGDPARSMLSRGIPAMFIGSAALTAGVLRLTTALRTLRG